MVHSKCCGFFKPLKAIFNWYQLTVQFSIQGPPKLLASLYKEKKLHIKTSILFSIYNEAIKVTLGKSLLRR